MKRSRDQESVMSSNASTKAEVALRSCPICDKVFHGRMLRINRIRHMKKCAEDHGIKAQCVIEYVSTGTFTPERVEKRKEKEQESVALYFKSSRSTAGRKRPRRATVVQQKVLAEPVTLRAGASGQASPSASQAVGSVLTQGEFMSQQSNVATSTDSDRGIAVFREECVKSSISDIGKAAESICRLMDDLEADWGIAASESVSRISSEFSEHYESVLAAKLKRFDSAILRYRSKLRPPNVQEIDRLYHTHVVRPEEEQESQEAGLTTTDASLEAAPPVPPPASSGVRSSALPSRLGAAGESVSAMSPGQLSLVDLARANNDSSEAAPENRLPTEEVGPAEVVVVDSQVSSTAGASSESAQLAESEQVEGDQLSESEMESVSSSSKSGEPGEEQTNTSPEPFFPGEDGGAPFFPGEDEPGEGELAVINFEPPAVSSAQGAPPPVSSRPHSTGERGGRPTRGASQDDDLKLQIEELDKNDIKRMLRHYGVRFANKRQGVDKLHEIMSQTGDTLPRKRMTRPEKKKLFREITNVIKQLPVYHQIVGFQPVSAEALLIEVRAAGVKVSRVLMEEYLGVRGVTTN